MSLFLYISFYDDNSLLGANVTYIRCYIHKCNPDIIIKSDADPTTTNGVKCTSVELLKSNIKLEKEVYLITTFDEEADALSELTRPIPSDQVE
ncbi:MAG: hypothetical protein WCF23_12340 [Candidatus Nitrosopolaris sp.]